LGNFGSLKAQLGNWWDLQEEGAAVRGIIEARGPGHWRVRVYAGREAGRTHWVSRTIAGTKRTAQKELAKLVTEVEAGTVAKRHLGSVADLLDRWLEDIGPTRSPGTMKEHHRSVDKDIKPALGDIGLHRLTGRDLDRFYAQLLARGLSKATVRRRHAVLSAALKRAVKWGMLPSNPADRATPPGMSPITASAPGVSDVQALIATAEATDPVLAAAIALGAVTGARRGELCALRWSDVDWERRTLRIARSLTVIKREVTEGPTKTHQRRDIAIDGALDAFLNQRRRHQEAYAASAGTTLVPDPYLLSRCANGGAPCRPDGITGGFHRLAKKSGVTSHFHELRHFAATTAIAAGVDVRTVAGRLGHADPSVTLRVYAHAMEARDRELAGVLGAMVLGPPSATARAELG
jgi:integrase